MIFPASYTMLTVDGHFEYSKHFSHAMFPMFFFSAANNCHFLHLHYHIPSHSYHNLFDLFASSTNRMHFQRYFFFFFAPYLLKHQILIKIKITQVELSNQTVRNSMDLSGIISQSITVPEIILLVRHCRIALFRIPYKDTHVLYG